MLICFEGLDGVGKSIIAKELSLKAGLDFVEKPINKLLELGQQQSDKVVDKLYDDYSCNMQAMHYLYGYLSVLEDSKKKDIILDRGFLSTYYFSFTEENKMLFDFFINTYGKPDLTIILYASIEERLKRIRRRDALDVDLQKKRLYEDGYVKYFDGIKRYQAPHLLISTENMSQDQVLEICHKILVQFQNDQNSIDELKKYLAITNFDLIKNLKYDDFNILIDKSLEENKKSSKILIRNIYHEEKNI